MKEECLICKAPLEYLNEDIEMECVICHKKELSKTRCINGHYVCNECHTQGIDEMLGLCLNETSKNPLDIINKMMAMPFCHMHGPEHHIMVGMALLTAYRNAGGKIDLEKSLLEMRNRGKSVPGGACGFWGACGAGISTGMFVSIISGSTPLGHENFGLSHKMTAKSLDSIGEIGGPRCCKRDSYLSILNAIEFVKEHFDIEMEKSAIVCEYSSQNNQCIGKRCPFSKTFLMPHLLFSKIEVDSPSADALARIEEFKKKGGFNRSRNMERRILVQRTTEYLLSLRDESILTMRQAVLVACPEAKDDINDMGLFDLLDEISDSVRKTGAVLDFTAHDGLVEGLPFNLDFIVRKKRLQKVQIISDLLCYGPCPEPEDAVEQRITISATGKVWFTEYLFGEIGCEKKPIGRKLQFSIGKEKAMAILSKIANYLEEEPMVIQSTDIGDWKLIATDPVGNVKQMSCSMCGDVVADGVDLTDFIREQIPIEDLAVFGGGSEEEST